MPHNHKAQTDSTTELPPVRITTNNEPGSGAYRRDKNNALRWLIASLITAAALLLWKHETVLSAMNVKIDLLMDHFGLEMKK